MSVDADHAAICSECGEDREVDLPERLIEACVSHRLILFVGSGASTESHNVMPDTFYHLIEHKLGRQGESMPFPDLMEAFVAEYSRTDLVLEFFERVRYIEKFEDLRRRAVKFHQAVGVIPFFREIITTNWDDYFERETGAIPLVTGADFDYWNVPIRKVLKIHGSSQNPGSIIATRSEYEASLEALRDGALGIAARHLIATSSVVFLGYSMRDDDIRDVIGALRKDLGQAAQRVYFVHPSDSFESPIDGATVLRTSAASFAQQLDDALVYRSHLHPMSMYDRVFDIHKRVARAMQRSADLLPQHRHPLSIYNHAYQDGVLHACQRLESSIKYGDDRAVGHLNHIIRSYDELSSRARQRRDYWNVAYFEGYATGLMAPLMLDFPVASIPLYFCPGVEHETSFARVSKAIRGGEATHKTAYRWALRVAERAGRDMVTQHTPFL